MGKLFKFLLSLGGMGLLGFLIFGMSMTACFSFRKTDRKTEKFFQKANVPVRIVHDTFAHKNVRWVEVSTNSPSGTLMLFIHGAPGGADAFYAYLADSSLRSRAQLVSIDRLGYGYSDYGEAETDLSKQADLVRHVYQQYAADTIWLVGHSYGGPIVAKVAMEHPGEVHGLVMISPVNDPATEKIFWYSGFAKWKASRWMLSKALRVSGTEKYAHIDALRLMEPYWQDLQLPVLHVHGNKDGLADPSNIEFSKQHIDPRYLRIIELEKMGHLIPFTQFDTVRNILFEVLQQTYWQE